MNKLSLIISGVLVLVIAFLFYETQELKGKLTEEEVPVETFEDLEETKSDLTVAFVRGDSIMMNYKYVQVEQDLLIAKAKSSQNKIESAVRKAEKESQPYIDHMNSGRATQSDAQVAEETIRALEYSLAQLQQDEQQKISRLEADFQFAFYNRITKYLKKYGEENGIDIVFNHEPGGQTLLYAADMFDVTDEVVAGLNKEYELEMNPVEEE